MDDTQQEPTKRCPLCGEQILVIAIKCKHCGSMLSQVEPSSASTPSQPAPVVAAHLPDRGSEAQSDRNLPLGADAPGHQVGGADLQVSASQTNQRANASPFEVLTRVLGKLPLGIRILMLLVLAVPAVVGGYQFYKRDRERTQCKTAVANAAAECERRKPKKCSDPNYHMSNLDRIIDCYQCPSPSDETAIDRCVEQIRLRELAGME
jgi:hypothetical protein